MAAIDREPVGGESPQKVVPTLSQPSAAPTGIYANTTLTPTNSKKCTG